MRFNKTVVFGFAGMIVCLLIIGCQKKPSPDAAEPQGNSQIQREDQQLPEDAGNVSNSPSIVAGEQREIEDVAAGSRAASQQDEMANAEDESAADEEQVSFGRMMGGVFRAARSLVPIPAAGSSDAPQEPSSEAPTFPQQ